MAFAVDLTGTLLDRRYQITGLLGKGGMGHVYDAVHVALDQRVAVKVLHPRYAYEQRFRERFLQEARAASKIRHRNVVEIKDFGDTPDGSVYFVMEYLDGHDVGVELKRHGSLPWSRTRGILLQAASALRAAHAKRIIHRDIKPGNCFLTRSDDGSTADFVKLLDFGIAKVGSDSHADAQDKGLTGTGEVFGTASYMAPEQARGETLDARSDMYSLGIMAYEMLTGQVPFTGVNAIHVITRHLNDRPEPLRSVNPEIPAVVEAVVLEMIAKAPRDRFASMEALEQALRGIPANAGEKRRTRAWSSPGELRALVQEKKAAAGVVVGPGGAKAAGDGGGTDAERTRRVVPGGAAVAERPVAKKTLVPGDASRSGAAAGHVLEPRAGTDVVTKPAVAALGSPMAAQAAVVAAPIAVTPVGSAPLAVTPVGSAPLAVTPVGPAPVEVPLVGSAPLAVSAAITPSARFAASVPEGGRGDGTSPPPGAADRAGSSSSWYPSTASTGPMGRIGDTGSETKPQSLEAMGGPGISGRLVAVVGLLVLLVGGASALGTMAVLSQRRGGETGGAAAAAAVEVGAKGGGGVEEAVAPGGADGDPAQDVELDEDDAVKGVELATPVADVGAAVEQDEQDGSEPQEVIAGDGEGTEPEEGVEPDEGGEPDGVVEPSPAEQPSTADEPTEPARPSVPAYETDKCAKVRAAANSALGQRQWANAARHAKQKRCWSASEDEARRGVQVRALLELGRFAECMDAGRRATDPKIVKMVNVCRKRTEG